MQIVVTLVEQQGKGGGVELLRRAIGFATVNAGDGEDDLRPPALQHSESDLADVAAHLRTVLAQENARLKGLAAGKREYTLAAGNNSNSAKFGMKIELPAAEGELAAPVVALKAHVRGGAKKEPIGFTDAAAE